MAKVFTTVEAINYLVREFEMDKFTARWCVSKLETTGEPMTARNLDDVAFDALADE